MVTRSHDLPTLPTLLHLQNSLEAGPPRKIANFRIHIFFWVGVPRTLKPGVGNVGSGTFLIDSKTVILEVLELECRKCRAAGDMLGPMPDMTKGD